LNWIGKMLRLRCKECNKEIEGHPTQTRSCGCPNMSTIIGDRITAIDLSKVVMINSETKKHSSNVLSPSDLQFQEERRKRKVRKLDFEER